MQNVYKSNTTIVLDDWGFDQVINSQTQGKRVNAFMAPEVVQGKGVYDVSEVWSIGVMLFVFLFGIFPQY